MITETLPANQESSDLNQLCERLKEMGYRESKRIRIYGQDFEVISNPFPKDHGIAVEAQPKGTNQKRVVQLPLPILQMGTRKKLA
ncbi:MAG TPA: hypothetical protein VF753_12400 [Terriglobales bacterium]